MHEASSYTPPALGRRAYKRITQMPVNLSNVVPSNIGEYAACTQRLAYDGQFGKVYTTNCYADFGTICHYWTQLMLGCAPAKQPTEEQYKLASTVPELKHKGLEALIIAAKACGNKAIKSLPNLPEGTTWISETKAYDKNILAKRVGRKGDVCGFGGDIDIMASDRSELWDFKFVGKPVDTVKTTYIWQLGSYHVTSGIPNTGILFVTRDAKWSGLLKINWTLPVFSQYAQTIRNFLELLSLPNVDNLVYPMEGSHCEWCAHKSRCPTKLLPNITTKHDMEVTASAANALECLLAPARLAGSTGTVPDLSAGKEETTKLTSI